MKKQQIFAYACSAALLGTLIGVVKRQKLTNLFQILSLRWQKPLLLLKRLLSHLKYLGLLLAARAV